MSDVLKYPNLHPIFPGPIGGRFRRHIIGPERAQYRSEAARDRRRARKDYRKIYCRITDGPRLSFREWYGEKYGIYSSNISIGSVAIGT